jgi:hypothetical protein
MATRQGSQVYREDGRVVYSWAGLLQSSSDVGSAAGIQGKAVEYVVSAVGTFGAAGSVALQGSNDGGATWFAMDDAGGTVIAMTTNKIWRISHMPLLVRPAVTAGDGTTNLAVSLVGTLR